jgi:hypothetical protein
MGSDPSHTTLHDDGDVHGLRGVLYNLSIVTEVEIILSPYSTSDKLPATVECSLVVSLFQLLPVRPGLRAQDCDLAISMRGGGAFPCV